MFDEDTKESLHRAEDGSMDHDGAFFTAVGVAVGEVKPLGKRHVELNCPTLPSSSKGIEDVEVDFWAVKCAVSLVDLIRFSVLIEGFLQTFGGSFPLLICADGFFWAS